MHTTVKFAKVRPTAIIPTKREEDAGFDIYANFEEDYMIIQPHETKMIPTGIASACDTDYCFVLKERGSTGTKGMAQRCGVIDSGYRNEIFVPITNTTNSLMIIYKQNVSTVDIIKELSSDNADNLFGTESPITYPYNKAIAQILVIPVPTVDIEECTYEELKAIPSSRGMGALGSSGK